MFKPGRRTEQVGHALDTHTHTILHPEGGSREPRVVVADSGPRRLHGRLACVRLRITVIKLFKRSRSGASASSHGAPEDAVARFRDFKRSSELTDSWPERLVMCHGGIRLAAPRRRNRFLSKSAPGDPISKRSPPRACSFGQSSETSDLACMKSPPPTRIFSSLLSSHKRRFLAPWISEPSNFFKGVSSPKP